MTLSYDFYSSQTAVEIIMKYGLIMSPKTFNSWRLFQCLVNGVSLMKRLNRLHMKVSIHTFANCIIMSQRHKQVFCLFLFCFGFVCFWVCVFVFRYAFFLPISQKHEWHKQKEQLCCTMCSNWFPPPPRRRYPPFPLNKVLLFSCPYSWNY